jgi:hypothetical protein
MRFIRPFLFIIVLLVVVLQASLAMAAHQGMADYQHEKAAKFVTIVADNKAELLRLGSDNWDDAMLSEYGVNVCWLLYYSINSYMSERDEIPNSLNDLVTAGLLNEIPGNPLNNWEPVQMLELGNGFSALDLVIQKAPSNYQSLVGSFDDYSLTPLSFELAVYGPRVDHFQGSAIVPNADNASWAQSPAGALIMVGTFTETADTTLNKLREYYEQHSEER